MDQKVSRNFETIPFWHVYRNKSEIGVRVPSHPVLHELFKHLEEPLITTSLNKLEDEIQEYFDTEGL